MDERLHRLSLPWNFGPEWTVLGYLLLTRLGHIRQGHRRHRVARHLEGQKKSKLRVNTPQQEGIARELRIKTTSQIHLLSNSRHRPRR